MTRKLPQKLMVTEKTVVTYSSPIIGRIAEILGLKHLEYCKSFMIDVEAGEIVKVTTTFYLEQNQAEQIAEALEERSYILLEAQQGEPATMSPERSPSDHAPSH